MTDNETSIHLCDKDIVENLLKIEIARNNDDTCLIFNSLNFSGLRIGKEFTPRIGETITYTDAKL